MWWVVHVHLPACLYKANKVKKVNLYSSLLCLCVTRESHSFTCHSHTNHTCLYSLAASVIALWLEFIAPTHEGMARLSWPGCLVSYREKCRHWKLNVDMVTHLSTNRARRRLTSLIESNTPPLRVCVYMVRWRRCPRRLPCLPSLRYVICLLNLFSEIMCCGM